MKYKIIGNISFQYEKGWKVILSFVAGLGFSGSH